MNGCEVGGACGAVGEGAGDDGVVGRSGFGETGHGTFEWECICFQPV